MMKNFSGSPLHSTDQSLNHVKERNKIKYGAFSAVPRRFSLRCHGFCMATLFLFCLGSLFYQLNGGPPKILLDVRQYLDAPEDNTAVRENGGDCGQNHCSVKMSNTRVIIDNNNVARQLLEKPQVPKNSKKGESTYRDDHGPPAERALPFPSQVIYNRVGKCGSRTLLILLKLLSDRHHYNFISSDIHNRTRISKHEQVELMKNISNIPQPYLYTRHIHFLNFTRFRIDQPVYINMIRDPINRFLSNYFFRRFGDWRGEQNGLIRTPQMKDDERYLDINVCILENYLECSNPRVFYIVPYFCGQHPQCREPGVWALERAKQNVIENYLLVGILEELEDVLILLERLLPDYFTGVLGIYKSPDYTKVGNMTGTVRKHTPSLEALQVLYHRMRYEYDFYNFVRDQFHLLKKKIGLKSISQPPAYSPAFLKELSLRTPEPLDEDEELDTDMEDANSWLVHP